MGLCLLILSMQFRKYILFYIFSPLCILFIGASYVRFFITHDYIVAYEGVCDPVVNDCFIGCEDDECSEEYYYSEVQKYAADLLIQCGKDITNCESANICLPTDDTKCSVTYCNVATGDEACESVSEDSAVTDTDKIQPTYIETEQSTSSNEEI